MNFKRFTVVLFLIFSIFPAYKVFAQSSNTGFIPANIWYSKDPFEEGDKIKIYTLIFNPDTKQLSGTVNFFDNTVLLGKKDFTLSPNTTKDISIDWSVTAGDHNIFGQIENARFLLVNGKYETVTLSENQTEKSSRTVSKKIIVKAASTDSASSITNTAATLVSDIKNLLSEKTPDFIIQSATSTVNTFEEFRKDTIDAGKLKEVKLEKEIKALDNMKIDLDKQAAQNTLLKPFKQVELFFLSVSLLILNNSVLSYGISAVIILLVLRYIWRKIF